MFLKKINKISKKKVVLVVPLDWGLGHATRCIPLIKHLQLLGVEVIIGAERNTKSLLQHEFHQLTFLELPGYRVRYASKRSALPFTILLQVPRILSRIWKEHAWLKKVEKKYELQAIISDNRFGLYHKSIPCIYLTHQLLIKTGNAITEKIARRIHYWFIRKYSACWVPDFAGSQNIAGLLSHPKKLPGNEVYIGGVSRFEKTGGFQKDRLLVIISGPEPQRTIFESILLQQLKNYAGKVTLVRGLPGNATNALPNLSAQPNLRIENHLSAALLCREIEKAEWVISRSGYTTIMDLVKMQQKAILVPTPGQTEQEYLAGYLMEQQYFYSCGQDDFDLDHALSRAGDFPSRLPSFDMDLYKKHLDQFVETL
jgi:uncharacterized protein (TIGR00661 family)